MDRDIHLVIILVDDADHLLITIPGRYTHQATKLTDTKVYMHDKVAGLHLLQLLHGQSHLASSSRIGTKIILVETVKYLVIRKETALLVVVDKALMERLVHWRELYLIAFQLLAGKNLLESLLLLLAVCQYI